MQEILDASRSSRRPGPRKAIQREVKPDETRFTGVTFKIQANMDPAHRDRIAFVRVCSGKFERGMKLNVVRSKKAIRPGSVVSFLSQRRELLDVAYPGDIIGIPNHGTLQLGDTLTEGEDLQFTGLPFFAPEIFQAVEVADPMKSKQLKLGLAQLGEEGAIQVFRPHHGGTLLLGAVGQLQFEVVAHRLQHEYSVPVRVVPSKFTIARWVTCDDAKEMDPLHRGERPPHRLRRRRRTHVPRLGARGADGHPGALGRRCTSTRCGSTRASSSSSAWRPERIGKGVRVISREMTLTPFRHCPPGYRQVR